MNLPSLGELVARGARVPEDLGERAEDRVLLRESPALAHNADALPGDAPYTAGDLVAGRTPAFVRAPTPLLRAPVRSSAGTGATLRILTYNVALLDRPYLGTRVTMPFMEVRRRALPGRLFQGEHDVLLLQEVWDKSDVQLFREAGARHGYRVLSGCRTDDESHGLVVAVRSGLVDPGQPLEVHESFFDARYALEEAPGPGIRRGFLAVRFRHAPSGLGVTLFDTHMTAFPAFFRQRSLQARELGLAVRRAPPGDLVVVGGDLNAGPYYRTDAWARPDGRVTKGWWSNAASYAILRHYGDLEDIAVLAGLPDDVGLAHAYRRDAATSARIPFGIEGMAETIPHTTFTATDANSLHQRSYGGTEQPARLDHLLVRRRDGATVRVLHARLAYTERTDLGAGQPIEISDHYGVAAVLHLPAPDGA